MPTHEELKKKAAEVIALGKRGCTEAADLRHRAELGTQFRRLASPSTILELLAENERLKELVKHCWVHSGYTDCGYSKMGQDERKLYNSIIGRCQYCEGEGCRECVRGFVKESP